MTSSLQDCLRAGEMGFTLNTLFLIVAYLQSDLYAAIHSVDYLLAEEFTIVFNCEARDWLDAAQMERPKLDLESLLSHLSLQNDRALTSPHV